MVGLQNGIVERYWLFPMLYNSGYLAGLVATKSHVCYPWYFLIRDQRLVNDPENNSLYNLLSKGPSQWLLIVTKSQEL